MKAAILINPMARRNRKGLTGPLTQAATNSGVTPYLIENFNTLPALMSNIASENPELLFISGGDGTVHAALTEILGNSHFDNPPLFALMPHGTTNVTTLGISLTKPDPEQISRIMVLAKSYEIVTKRPIRVTNLKNLPPQYGFIFAAGAGAKATRRVQQGANSKGLTGDFAIAISLGGDIIKKLFGADPTLGGLLSPEMMAFKTRGGLAYEEETLTILATTLDRLVLGANPFWNQDERPLHITRVGPPPRNLLRCLFRVLYGNRKKLPQDIFQSFSEDGFTLELNEEIVIDGEFYEPGGKLEISAGPELKFIRLP